MGKGPKKKHQQIYSKMLGCTLRNVNDTSFSLTLLAKMNKLFVSSVHA